MKRLADLTADDAYRARTIPSLERLAQWHRDEADRIEHTVAVLRAEKRRRTA